ncbi:MoaD/ThiS family protein [Candidatus Woesearchaeota archaeon]|nr:MoaD/ThiS family protein [Candidatus Woesearchaeota archaeon]
MKVYYDREDKEYSIEAKNVRDMLKELKLLKNAVIVVVNDELVSEGYAFEKSDKVKILSVVSGG